jgi:nucleoside-diphosphate-sugar epimerase
MTQSALLIGGTGPTGPPIALGLAARGYEVTILHSGNHEIPEVAHLRHLHGDVFSEEGLRAALSSETFDVAIASYGRLRSIAEVLVGRVGRLISIGGAPVYRGFFDPAIHHPPGLPVPTREDAELATESDDGKSYRIGRTEQLLFASHPSATHFRYPYVYGPRQLAPREWCVVKRILDHRPFIILPDDGLSIIPYGYTENLAHALLLAVDHPEASMGEIFNCGDDEKLTIRQVVEIITDELGHDWELLSLPGDLATPRPPLDAELPHHPPLHRHHQTAGPPRLPRRRAGA